jgi:trigger factor
LAVADERGRKVCRAACEVAQRAGPEPGLQGAPSARCGRHGPARYRGGVPAALKTELTELPESRVRLQVEVPPSELDDRLERKARELGAKLRIPGFRRGKVPPPIVIRRLGREAVLEEAVRDTLARWYADAVESAGIVPVGDPQVDLGELPSQGQALEFSIEIGVLPKAQLGRYKGLEVGRREPEVDEQRIDQEIAAMRERLARLERAERSAASGDFLVIDHEGELEGDAQAEGEQAASAQAALSGRDQLVELGAGRLPEDLERALIGASAGEQRSAEVDFPAEYGESPLAGRRAKLQVTVKEVKEKQLPDLDEDFAIDAGFEDLQELRVDIRTRLEEAERQRALAEFREAALDAAVDAATVQTPPALVQARAKEMWERMLHSLSHRGLSREAYLSIDGRSEEDILAELAPDAERALRREAVITAVVEAEGISPSEQELEEALQNASDERESNPAELVAQLRQAGRLDELREDLAARTAVDLIAEHAEPIAVELAQAREKLWTPESEQAQAASSEGQAAEQGQSGAKLWTPDR